MVTVTFTPNLQRLVATPNARVDGENVGQVLESYFRTNPQVRSYILDDQGSVRHHVAIFINQEMIRDRQTLSDRVHNNDEVFVMQALSGG